MILKIYSSVFVAVAIIVFLVFVITPLVRSGRIFIKESIGNTENYLMEIIEDIEDKKPTWVVAAKYILHLIIAIILGLFVALLWPILFLMLGVTIVSYLSDKDQI